MLLLRKVRVSNSPRLAEDMYDTWISSELRDDRVVSVALRNCVKTVDEKTSAVYINITWDTQVMFFPVSHFDERLLERYNPKFLGIRVLLGCRHVTRYQN